MTHGFVYVNISCSKQMKRCVRDKSNLNIGYENNPKTVRFFFYRDLSAGRVTSFSM